jgi:DinB family protein
MKEKLRQALAETRQKETELEELCSDIPADPAGRWHPKDHLAHIAWHRDRNANVIEAVHAGAELPPAVEEDVNAAIYAETRDQPVAEVIAFARRSWDRLESAIEAATEEELERQRPDGPQGRKLIDGSPGDHVATHLFWCHIEAGNEKEAEAVLLWARDLSARTSTDPRSHAVGTYNLACYYARTGQAADALPLLRESFEVAPYLKDWSQKDPDLDPIRDDPRIVELLGAPAPAS